MIVSANKLVPRLTAPVPLELELAQFGLAATLARLPQATVRGIPLSPNGGVIADDHAPVDDPAALAARYAATVGIVDHGLFPAAMGLRGRDRRRDRSEALHAAARQLIDAR